MTTAYRAAVLVVAILSILPPFSSFGAQSGEVKMDPAVCVALQKQIDEVVALGNSTTLTEEEKISRLTASIASSLATMLKTTKDTPEAAKIAQQWLTMLNQVMAAAKDTKSSGNQTVSPEAKRGLDIARNRMKPYLAVMKILCPNLVVPDSVSR